MHLKLYNKKNDTQNSITLQGDLAIEGHMMYEILPDGERKQLLFFNSSTDTWGDGHCNEWTNFMVKTGVPNEEVLKAWPNHCQAGMIAVIDTQKDFMPTKGMSINCNDETTHETFQRVFSHLTKGTNPLTEFYSALKPAHTCKNCGADLSERNAINREYINKDDGPNRYGDGHFNVDNDFEPDRGVDLSDGRFDNVDGSDTCGNCGEVVG